MKKLFNKVRDYGRKMAVKAVVVVSNNRGEGFIDQGVAILISVVIGALLLAGLYTLFGDTILPTLTEKISGLFNYKG